MNKIMKKLTSFLAIFTMLVFIFLAGIFSNEYNSGVDIVSLGDNYTGQLEYDADRVYNDVRRFNRTNMSYRRRLWNKSFKFG